MIRSILYATDLGFYAPYVLQHALSQSQAFKAELYVVHAVEPLGLLAHSVLRTYLGDAQLQDLQAQGLDAVLTSIEARVLESFKEELDSMQQGHDLIRAVQAIQGDPADVITTQAKALGVDLVVIGTRSQGGDAPTPLGRTAHRVVQTCTVPVHVVPMLPPL
ncbi:universal stress protein [Pseudomonas matsuisoli]|uniref:UspA domain-containing protein n=1 Tax=Pseudomonas matsuisoli TaxID=1515666 RepID=A0A917Q1R9_9PSED|nr:universal stress protein [Pseudomonas matsuisoli]GGK06137.1 hypothetical protein GCM10009304_35240 [Pseudomonas matsuisoli]